VFVGRPYSSGRHLRICSGSADPRLWGPRLFASKNHKSHEEESALGFGGAGSAELCAFQHYSAVLNMGTSTMILTSKNRIPWTDEEPQTNAKNTTATRLDYKDTTGKPHHTHEKSRYRHDQKGFLEIEGTSD
jgi:hypothetical protein